MPLTLLRHGDVCEAADVFECLNKCYLFASFRGVVMLCCIATIISTLNTSQQRQGTDAEQINIIPIYAYIWCDIVLMSGRWCCCCNWKSFSHMEQNGCGIADTIDTAATRGMHVCSSCCCRRRVTRMRNSLEKCSSCVAVKFMYDAHCFAL